MHLDPAQVSGLATRYATAWSSHDPAAVASFFAEDGEIAINQGEASKGRDALAEMARSFYADFPDLIVRADDVRSSGNTAVFLWMLEGTHAQSKRFVQIRGWDAWTLNESLKITKSLSWFDAVDYERQCAEGFQAGGTQAEIALP